jgi:dUTPase
MLNYNIVLGENAIIPKRANELDCGYDLVAASEPKIVGQTTKYNSQFYTSIDYIEYTTNIKIQPELAKILISETGTNFGAFIFPRSSLSKYNLLLCNSVGTIDPIYTGECILRFKYIIQPIDMLLNYGEMICHVNSEKIYKKGDKIGQLVFLPSFDVEFKKVKKLEETVRSAGGFGSTGK